MALAARRKDRLDVLATEIGNAGGRALVIECDVTKEQQATEAVERTVSELGRLDTLVNNAGVMLLGPAAGAPLSEWQRMVELNVLGLLYCAHAAIPHLLRAAGDSPRQVADMVNISSVAGRVARNGNGVYSLTKHGVGAFSESLRQELASRYVRVSLVEPGATATELAGHNRPEILDSIRNQFGQRMEASDIADAICLHHHPASACRDQRAPDSSHRAGAMRHLAPNLSDASSTRPRHRVDHSHSLDPLTVEPSPTYPTHGGCHGAVDGCEGSVSAMHRQ